MNQMIENGVSNLIKGNKRVIFNFYSLTEGNVAQRALFLHFQELKKIK